jgi:hypothetical protein
VLAPVGVGKRLVMALGHLCRTESTVFLEYPETLDADTVVKDQAETIAEAGRPRPGLYHLYGWSKGWQRCGRVCGGVAEWATMGWHQDPHGLQPGGLWRGVCSVSQSSGSGGKAADHSGVTYGFHRRAGSHPTHGIGRAGPRTEVHHPG